MEAPFPNTGGKFADEGTAAHELAAMCLQLKAEPAGFLGKKMSNGVAVDADMVTHVAEFIQVVNGIVGPDGMMFIEQRVDFSNVVGVKDSFGTSDIVAIPAKGGELCIVDLKYGRGVEVSAEKNEQLMIYALGALEMFGALDDFTSVRLVIHQPRLGGVSECVVSVKDLRDFAKSARTCGAEALKQLAADAVDLASLNPGEKQCRFCKAKATCPALREFALTNVADGFVDLDEAPTLAEKIPATTRAVQTDADMQWLAALMPHLDLIEGWLKAVRGRVFAELSLGNEVPGYKLVEGRRGARKWIDEAIAEASLKAMRLKSDQMYDYKVISPTSAEKLLAKQNPTRWAKLTKLISRADGKPSVAPVTDPRPAVKIEDGLDFANLDDGSPE
jgi:hypothetical protein